jgi:hypothetical protein
MADPARQRATYKDLQKVPSHWVAEILNGELVTSPRPAPPHAQAASSLSGELHAPFHRSRGGPGGWIILNEPELHLHEDVLVPDIAGWRRERMPALPKTSAYELLRTGYAKCCLHRLPRSIARRSCRCVPGKR